MDFGTSVTLTLDALCFGVRVFGTLTAASCSNAGMAACCCSISCLCDSKWLRQCSLYHHPTLSRRLHDALCLPLEALLLYSFTISAATLGSHHTCASWLWPPICKLTKFCIISLNACVVVCTCTSHTRPAKVGHFPPSMMQPHVQSFVP